MNLYPAIDILGGHAVRLVRGDFDDEHRLRRRPARRGARVGRGGAERLHVVDLDGARAGEPVNLEHLRRIAAQSGVPVQYGGGLRSEQAVDAALAAGAARVVIGTAAFRDPGARAGGARRARREGVLVAVDVRGGAVATHGWLEARRCPRPRH